MNKQINAPIEKVVKAINGSLNTMSPPYTKSQALKLATEALASLGGKSGYCCCKEPLENSDEDGFLFCDNCGLDIRAKKQSMPKHPSEREVLEVEAKNGEQLSSFIMNTITKYNAETAAIVIMEELAEIITPNKSHPNEMKLSKEQINSIVDIVVTEWKEMNNGMMLPTFSEFSIAKIRTALTSLGAEEHNKNIRKPIVVLNDCYGKYPKSTDVHYPLTTIIDAMEEYASQFTHASEREELWGCYSNNKILGVYGSKKEADEAAPRWSAPYEVYVKRIEAGD